MAAYQIAVTSTNIFTPAGTFADEDEVTIFNLGPNTIYITTDGTAATVAGGLPIPTNTAYTTSAATKINAICSVLQVTPADTRVNVERSK